MAAAKASAAQKTLVVRGVDRDRGYFYWQWITPEVTPRKVYVVDPAELAPVLDRLAESLPGVHANETQKEMLARILTTGALAVPDAERSLSGDLGRILLPDALAAEIVDAHLSADGQPVLIRLMPSAMTASVPWELFPVVLPDGTERRLIDIADFVHEVPAGIHAGRARVPSAWDATGSALYVVDPVTRASGPVLEAEGHRAFRDLAGKGGHPASKVDDEFSRRDLSVALTDQRAPARLFYVGHVVQEPDVAGSSSLLLSDPDDTFGVSPVYNAVSRPLSALDLFEGTQNWERRIQIIEEREGLQRRSLRWPINRETRRAGARIWPMPPRVALVACNSGSDLAHAEPFGLAIALINAGAELVTATKWTLPTDHAYIELAAAQTRPLLETAIALDAAHGAPDPVADIARWQRGRMEAWRSGDGDPTASPLLWAAFSTYAGTERPVESVVPNTEAIRLAVV